ncbi:MAG: nicotinate-nucleotide adenylyltransferase [Thermodesulfovibrionales bacterium]
MNNRIGILGGTFNPIHYGHLRAAEEVRERIDFEKILFIPSCNPPLKGHELASPKDRYAMTKLAIEKNPYFEISDIECRRKGKSYTVETLTELKILLPDKDFFLILGIDSFVEIPQWYSPDKLMDMVDFIVVSRPGFRFMELAPMLGSHDEDREILNKLDMGLTDIEELNLSTGRKVMLMNITSLNIAATTIRRLVRDGKSIKYLLPESVEYYIISNKLYR